MQKIKNKISQLSQRQRRFVQFSLFALVLLTAATVISLTAINSQAAVDPNFWNKGPIPGAYPRGATHIDVPSPSMGVNVGVVVYTPPGYDPADTSKRYPVIYFLHGLNGNENNYIQSGTTWNYKQPSSISSTPNLIGLIETGQADEAIVVFPNGGAQLQYIDSTDDKPETFIVTELIPTIDRLYNTIPSREGRGGIGFSMGGGGIFRYAVKYPNLFCGVVSYSTFLDRYASNGYPLVKSYLEQNAGLINQNSMRFRFTAGANESGWTKTLPTVTLPADIDKVNNTHGYSIYYETDIIPDTAHNLFGSETNLSDAGVANSLYSLRFLHNCFEQYNRGTPVASFSFTPVTGPAPLDVDFNASGSSDSDGNIVSYTWNFGDGVTTSGVNVSHTYQNYGEYTVTLTVTDNSGLSHSTTQTVKVSDPSQNIPPVAAFTATPLNGTAPLLVTFSAAGSSDSDGTVTSYAWTFGDNTSGSGLTTTHTYASAGEYDVTLVVSDDKGETSIATSKITVSPGSSGAPTAVISASPLTGKAPLKVTFNAGSSYDSNGTIVSYYWNLGNGTTSTAKQLRYTYSSPGTYNVTLTVTDNSGLTNSSTVQVTATQ